MNNNIKAIIDKINKMANELLKKSTNDSISLPKIDDLIIYLKQKLGDNYNAWNNWGEDSECMDFLDLDIKESNFTNEKVAKKVFYLDTNMRFRVFFKFHMEVIREYWSGRHNDYDISYDYGWVPDNDDIVIIASPDEEKYFDVTNYIKADKLEEIKKSISRQTMDEAYYDHISEYVTDDF